MKGIPDLFGTETSQTAARTAVLRLTVDHRRLFDAVAGGWLRPLDGNAGHTLGAGCSVRESAPAGSGHRIGVRMTLNANKLPDLDVLVHRDGGWAPAPLRTVRPADGMVRWPGAIPAFAITSLAVASEEEKTRLAGLSRGVSNVDLADLPISIADVGSDAPPPGGVPAPAESPREACGKLEVPAAQDALHGALAMAVWAVPRIDPWMAVLQASLAEPPLEVVHPTADLDATWWRFAPWRKATETPNALYECLWLAALEIFRQDCKEPQMARPQELLLRIGEHAHTAGGDGFKDAIASWKEDTARILRADATLQPLAWRANPVGLAIQLVLTRPDPARFKTWFKDRADLPPGVGWSAAVLCGLLNGYKRLATDFRGGPLQGELLAVKALSACSQESSSARWPIGPLDLRWRREGAHYVLSHGQADFACKPLRARGKWYGANFENEETRRAARKLAEDLDWPCHEILLADAEAPVSGPGRLSVQDGRLQARGKVIVHVYKASRFGIASFRRCVATELGMLPMPPVAGAPAQPTSPEAAIPGFHYEQGFLTVEEEKQLIEWIDRQAWSPDLARRVQHYGWRYDYRGRKVDASSYIGELPAVFLNIAQRLHRRQLVPQLPDQVIVNEYQPGQGISPHIDAPGSFADGIAMISMLDSWEMSFYATGKRKGTKMMLEKGSVAVLTHDARYKWRHEIVKRKSDPCVDDDGKPSRRKRQRRISLTFRKVIQG